jgi:predicted  nucleic acid-binding Zn-ribbon protein
MGEEKKVIPPAFAEASPETSSAAEEIAFDKADRAEQIENEKQKLNKELQEMESSLKESSGEEKEQLKSKIAQIRERLEATEHKQDELNQEDKSAEPASASDADKPRG